MNKIIKKARKLRKEYNLKRSLDFLDLCKIAQKKEWGLYTYSGAYNTIEIHELQKYKRKYSTFTYLYNNEISIFFNESLKEEDMIFQISHEIGHISLQHLAYDGIIGKSENNLKQKKYEQEADVFAKTLINSNQKKKNVFLFTLIGIIFSIVLTLFFKKIHYFLNENIFSEDFQNENIQFSIENTESKENISINENIKKFYITKHGEKYHLENCYSIRHSIKILISEDDAILLNYEPCKICEPDKKKIS